MLFAIIVSQFTTLSGTVKTLNSTRSSHDIWNLYFSQISLPNAGVILIKHLAITHSYYQTQCRHLSSNIHLPPCRIEQNDKGQTVVSYDISESVSSQVRLIANKSAFEFSFRFLLILPSTIFTLFISLKYRTELTPVFSLSSAILRSFD